MVRKNVYDILKREFGKYSSWAVWSDGDPEKPKSNVDDMTVFNQEGLLDILKTDYILVGLNASDHGHSKEAGGIEDWNGFHSGNNRKQQDYKIRHALAGTRLWGSYITDVFKGTTETESAKLKKQIKEDPSLLDGAKECLTRELKIIGGDPILIAFGNDSWHYLKKITSESEKKRIIKIRHYSVWGGPDRYKETVWKQLKDQGINP